MNRWVRFTIAAALVIVTVFCGYLYGRRSAAPPGVSRAAVGQREYTCSMHPFVLKDRSGSCPVCGMELVPKVAEITPADPAYTNLRHVSISPTQQVTANVATAPAVRKALNREIACTGSVAFNQERQAKVSAWVGGRIDRLLVRSVGSTVSRGAAVAELFSVDLYNAEVQYLLAYKTIKVLNSSVSVVFPINTQQSLGDAYERLRQLGFRDEQFAKLKNSIEPTVKVPITSPASGVVIEKLVQEGQYVNAGDPLFSVADLSLIWVELELFESDFPLVKVGQEVIIRSRSYPAEEFRGTIKLVYQFLDPKSRTVKLRVEIPNPDLKLKPDMYVQGSIRVPLAATTVVPAAAVMNTGNRGVVWVQSRPGVFVLRDVRTGVRAGNDIQILAGLKEGELVAVTGGYLIDSEAQLSRASGGANETVSKGGGAR